MRLTMALGLFVVCSLGLMTWLLGVATGPASGHATIQAAARVTIVSVTAGKPTELGFKLSKFSALPAGTIAFKVTNAGKVTHDFKICTSPVATNARNACVGKVTKMLKAGQSATLTVTLKRGKYEYLCSVPGRAAAGMKGLLGVGVKVVPKGAASAPAGSSPSSSTPASKTCAGPENTTVTVEEFSYGFKLSQDSVHCGTITFKQTNTDPPGRTTSGAHNFVIQDVPNYPELQATGATINPGKSATMTVTLAPGRFTYICNVSEHDELGQIGSLTVTG